MSIWKRLKNLWRLSAISLPPETKKETILSKWFYNSQQAKIIEPTLLDELEKNNYV
jgi:hypothetical protein